MKFHRNRTFPSSASFIQSILGARCFDDLRFLFFHNLAGERRLKIFKRWGGSTLAGGIIPGFAFVHRMEFQQKILCRFAQNLCRFAQIPVLVLVGEGAQVRRLVSYL